MSLRWREVDERRACARLGPLWHHAYPFGDLQGLERLIRTRISGAGWSLRTKGPAALFPDMGTTGHRTIHLPRRFADYTTQAAIRLLVHEAEHVWQRIEMGNIAFDAVWALSIRGRAGLELAAYCASIRAMQLAGADAAIPDYITSLATRLPRTYRFKRIQSAESVVRRILSAV